jgi:paired amphipathic helix protein Sin3a
MAHAPSGQHNTLGGSGGPAIFGGPLQQENTRTLPQDGPRGLPFQNMGPGHPLPSGPGGMPQGQQPILNVCDPLANLPRPLIPDLS